jgi:Mg/Co/Ni transporter MgtE
LSRRAAARLERLQIENVCVYVGGKQDWLAFDLPVEGELASAQTAGRLAQRNVPVCAPDDKLGEAQRRAQRAGWQECVVVDEQRVVMGLLDKKALQGDGALAAEQIMDPAPLTFRPHLTRETVAEYMKKKNMDAVLVTNSDGKLIGLVRYQDAQ